MWSKSTDLIKTDSIDDADKYSWERFNDEVVMENKIDEEDNIIEELGD